MVSAVGPLPRKKIYKKSKKKQERKNGREEVLKNIISLMEEGNLPPWMNQSKGGVSGRFHNHVTQHKYTGMNVFMLMMEGRNAPRWLTIPQIKSLGGRWSGKGTGLMRPYTLKVEGKELDENDDPVQKELKLFQWYYVWNVEQITGIDFEPLDSEKHVQFDPVEAIENLIANMPNPPEIHHDADGVASYSPPLDRISMQNRSTYGENGYGYYHTLLHEVAHWTGHKSRLNREGVRGFTHFGDDMYAVEELIADMASAFVCYELGILTAPVLENTASYINSWAKRFKADKNLLFEASREAEKVAQYILGGE